MIIVTGGSGKAGRACITELLAHNYEVASVDLIRPPFRFRAAAFPIKCDLKVDRSAFDRIVQAAGYISASTGEAPEANTIPIRYEVAEAAFDAAACIGCGACVATCKNPSAVLFTSAKVTQLALLPQGQVEARRRVLKMVDQTDKEAFGHGSKTRWSVHNRYRYYTSLV